MYQHLYNAGSNNEKFVPVVFSGSDTQYIPIPLQGSTPYCLDNARNEYGILLNRCRGLPRNQKPPVGGTTPLEKKERKTDVGVFFTSFIDVDLWNKARWSGCLYAHDKELREPPTLGLLFRDKTAAEKIFKGWRERLGERDRYNELRLSIIEGDLPEKPSGGYSVHISSNIENILRRADEQGIDLPKPHIVTISRMHYMTPQAGSTNLSLFRERFEQFGSYLLMPVIQASDSYLYGEELAIHKRHIEFRKTSDILNRNDPDSCVLPEFVGPRGKTDG
jgi:hypothetical protein